MKALVSKDQNNQVWITYNDPHYLAKRHNIEGKDAVLNKISDALNKFSNAAIAD